MTIFVKYDCLEATIFNECLHLNDCYLAILHRKPMKSVIQQTCSSKSAQAYAQAWALYPKRCSRVSSSTFKHKHISAHPMSGMYTCMFEGVTNTLQ